MRRRTWTGIKWAGLATSVVSVLLAGVLMWQAGPSGPIMTPVDQGATNQTQVESPVIVERRNGRVIWQLEAGEAKQQLDGQMHLTRPKLTLYTESDAKIPVSSDEAWFDPIRRNIRFTKNVVVLYQGWHLKCGMLMYSSSKDELAIPDAFTLTGKQMHATGKNMRINRSDELLYVDSGIMIDDTRPAWTGSGL